MHLKMTVGKIMQSLNAFKGSKPICDIEGLLIVRGVCRDENFEKYNSIKEYLEAKLKENGFEIADEDDIVLFVERINNVLKETMASPDMFGFEALKKSFESIGCECDYVIGKKGNLMVGVSMWFDKNRKNPKFVEVVGC
ncbi:DUF2120 family protein [Methanotorris igneus]|uniref:Uncharacterized conserved protein UCP921964 n=1 Tax=Methanotorris igneus (strain DSM 5666 / JCM 11834 / Kol 5) TaxID=880724 RepID=F6BCH8_METIK|nr:DUF2120 family protein [Methanotorris igneus]AEF96189.1 Uncharacterized conserved protein UCP921964 [Methanotorris igneus Kol 5]